MTIEKVTVGDAAELLAIYAPYVSDTAVSFEQAVPTESEFGERIRAIHTRYPYLKAVENGKIVGYAYANTFKPRKSYEYAAEVTIYVKQGCHGRGIGRTLYAALEKSLAGMGICNMNACVTVPETDDEYLTHDSLHFHEKVGFTPVGEFHKVGYKFGRWYNMVWLEKHIGEHRENMNPVRFGEWEIEEN